MSDSLRNWSLKVELGDVYLTIAGNVRVHLGPVDTACEAMANFLASIDYGDRPSLPVMTLDEAGERFKPE